MIRKQPYLFAAWFFTLYFGLGGLQFAVTYAQPRAGIPLLLAGVIACPKTHDLLKKKDIVIPRWLKIVLCLLLFFVYTSQVQIPSSLL